MIELSYKNLKAASMCKAKQDVRFYLCGVFVGRGIIAATNGHIALICNQESTEGIEVIIPKESIEAFFFKSKRPHTDIVTMRAVDNDLWILENVDCMEIFKPIDGKFPDIKRIDIKKPKGINFKQYPNFNIEYLSLFSKVGKVLNKTPQVIPSTENEVAYIDFNEDVHGLLMPMRI